MKAVSCHFGELRPFPIATDSPGRLRKGTMKSILPSVSLFRWLVFFGVAAVVQPVFGDSMESREADRDFLLEKLLPSRPPPNERMNAFGDRTWRDWLERTGELPPDFDVMPSNAFLPDPLVIEENGEEVPVTTPEQWERKREWIREQIQRWVFGKFPPKPENFRVASSEERAEGDVTIRDVVLEFGPDYQAKLHLELAIPKGEGPFPVFLTNHARNRSFWVNTAVNRGYIACHYRATDPRYGLPDDANGFVDVYPEYDFSSLARWAWAASRAVDYLQTRPEVIPDQIGLTGHSRNGKAALTAAAFDDRIGAVVASSGLTGEVHPWRFTSDPLVVESIQLLTGARPHWFHPRLRFFAGREHKLPVDQNSLMALIAPRGLMIYSAYSEGSANSFAIEQGYRSVREVYRFHESDEKIWLHLREGEHSVKVADIENFMDFFDAVFGRRNFPKMETWIYGYDFAEWREKSGIGIDPLDFPAQAPGDFLRTDAGESIADRDDWSVRKEELRAKIRESFGTEPSLLPVPLAERLREQTPPRRNWLELTFGRPQGDAQWRERLGGVGMGMSNLSFGPGLDADVFYPVTEDGDPDGENWPVVIWLHPYAHAVGWSAKDPWNPRRPNFVLDQRPQLDELVRRGFAVVAFDQIGFGGRTHEARNFYERYPEWSLLGKMVSDTRAVVDAVAAIEQFDASRIYFMCYSLGAKVGLLAAALDDQVAGVVAVSGVFPFRLHEPEDGTEGIEHYSHLHGLLPQLGFFVDHPERVPFDYDEVLALIAPRDVLVVAPELDRYAPVEKVRAEVEAAAEVFRLLDAESALELRTPHDFNRFPRPLQREVFDYLEERLK